MKKIIYIVLISITINFIFSQDNTLDIKKMNGWDYYEKGRYRESINALKVEKKSYPNRINIYVIMAWDYLSLRNYPSMEKISKEGLKIRPNDVRVIKNLAEAYYFQKKYSEAIFYFEKYIFSKYKMKDPYLAIVYYYLGVCFYNLNFYRKADIALSFAKYYRPKDIKIILTLANTKEKLEEYDKANNLFNNVLKIKPNNKPALEGIKRIKDINYKIN